MNINEAPPFYVCYPSGKPDKKNLYIFKLLPPTWFGRFVPAGNNTLIEIIQFFGEQPDKEIVDQTLKEAGDFLKGYFKQHDTTLNSIIKKSK